MKASLRLSVYILSGVLLAACQPHPAWAKKAAIVLSKNLAPFQEVLQGFVSDTNLEIQKYDIEGSVDAGKKLMAGFTDVDLVVTISKEATDAAKAVISGIPVVYTMVLEPAEFNRPGQRATGLLMQVKLTDQFFLLRRMFPAAKKIGVIYNPEFSAATVQEARAISQLQGFTLQPMAVANKETVSVVLPKLTELAPDVLWSVPDHTTVNPAVVSQIIAFTREHKLPFVSLSVYHVKSGALAAFSIDLKSIGIQTAKLAHEMLITGGKSRVEYPERVMVYVNPAVQKDLGISGFPDVPNLTPVQ